MISIKGVQDESSDPLYYAKILFCSTVYGWFNDSITGVEQGAGISIPVGYQKGATQAAQNLVFNVIDQPGTARMYAVIV